MPRKIVILTIFLSFLSALAAITPASAGAKEAREIVAGGNWRYHSVGQKSYRGSLRFEKDSKFRFFAPGGHNLRGSYRVSGSNICLKIFRVWGKREKCVSAVKHNGDYYMGNWRLRK